MHDVINSECLCCGAINCVADECTGFGEVPVAPSDDGAASCAADEELTTWWEGGK